MLNLERWCVKIKNINIEISSNDGLNVSGGVFFYILKDIVNGENVKRSMTYNLLNTAKYVVQLFYQTGTIYKCTSAKVEKIMAISQLIAYKSNVDLFKEKIISKNCGIGYSEIGATLYSEILDGKDGTEDRRFVTEAFCEENNVPLRYSVDLNDLSNELIEQLVLTFRTFAAYKSTDIGVYLNEFKNNLMIGNYVDKNRTIKYFKENDTSIKDNPVYDFIIRNTYPI